MLHRDTVCSLEAKEQVYALLMSISNEIDTAVATNAISVQFICLSLKRERVECCPPVFGILKSSFFNFFWIFTPNAVVKQRAATNNYQYI